MNNETKMRTFAVTPVIMDRVVALLPTFTIMWWSNALEVRFTFLVFKLSFLWCKDGIQK